MARASEVQLTSKEGRGGASELYKARFSKKSQRFRDWKDCCSWDGVRLGYEIGKKKVLLRCVPPVSERRRGPSCWP